MDVMASVPSVSFSICTKEQLIKIASHYQIKIVDGKYMACAMWAQASKGGKEGQSCLGTVQGNWAYGEYALSAWALPVSSCCHSWSQNY